MSFMESIKKYGSRAALKIRERSPEILITVGVTSFVASTVLACRATRKLDEVNKEYHDYMAEIDATVIKSAELNDGKYTEADAKKDRLATKGILVGKYIRLYGPSFGLAVFGLGCIVKSRNIMKNRTFAIMSAYNLVSHGFEAYRNKVKEELGEDQDLHFRYGTTTEEETIMTVDEDGKKVKEKITHTVLPEEKLDNAIYSRVFDSKCSNWNNHDDYNWIFLNAKQDYCNFLLMRNGVLFLNDAYDQLGFPRTYEGQEVGWSVDGGDKIVKFNVKPLRRMGSEDANTIARAMLVEFNVEGPVRSKLKLKA